MVGRNLQMCCWHMRLLYLQVLAHQSCAEGIAVPTVLAHQCCAALHTACMHCAEAATGLLFTAFWQLHIIWQGRLLAYAHNLHALLP